MNVALWVIAALLAATFGTAGLLKLSLPKEALAERGLAWTANFSARSIKLIGALELLAAIGLIAPPTLHIAPVFAPLAALGLIGMMVGAAVVHARRKESSLIAVNVVLMALAAVLVWGRCGPYPFGP